MQTHIARKLRWSASSMFKSLTNEYIIIQRREREIKENCKHHYQHHLFLLCLEEDEESPCSLESHRIW